MKFNTDTGKVDLTGAIKGGRYGMTPNAKAFKVLGDGIYDDKPKAIIQEICSKGFMQTIQEIKW